MVVLVNSPGSQSWPLQVRFVTFARVLGLIRTTSTEGGESESESVGERESQRERE